MLTLTPLPSTEHVRADSATAEDLPAAGMSAERRRGREVPGNVGSAAQTAALRQMGGVLPKCEPRTGRGIAISGLRVIARGW